MQHRHLIILITFSLLSCNQTKPTDPASEDKLLADKEIANQNNSFDTPGVLFATIEFKIKATKEDLEIFEDGIVPWISLQEPNKEIDRLIKADEIVLPYFTVTLLIDYPLTNPAIFTLSTNEKGFSRKQLIQEISKKYHEIYKEEETTSTTKTIPIDQREGLINRNQTNGKYGVWGHDLSDLDLSSIEVYKNTNGKIHLILRVES